MRNVAKRYGLSLCAIFRHFDDHIPATLANAQGAKDAAKADDLLGRLLELVNETREVLKKAKAEQDHGLTLQAIARAERESSRQSSRASSETEARP